MLFPAPAPEARPVPTLEAKPASTPDATPAIARFLPSLTDIAFLMPIIFVFIKLTGARVLLGDGDTGWHVRTGEWILANHRVPQVDMFSFSRPGAPWFAWEWLWDVLFARIHHFGGLASVVTVSLAVICLTTVALFRLVRHFCGNGFVAIAVTLLATGACSIHWLARPHLFTLLFFTLTLQLVNRAAGDGTSAPRGKLLAWLVPLTLVWTNLHGGFFVVFLVLACYIGSNLLNAAIEADPERRARFLRFTKPWVLTGLGCFAVTFINPYGWGLHKHIIEYLTDPYQLQHINEFQPINFHAPYAVYYEPLMVLALITALWDAKRRRFADVFMNLGWLHLSLIATRNIPLFAIACAPFIARSIVSAIDAAAGAPVASWIRDLAAWFRKSSAELEVTDRIPRTYLVSAVSMLFVAVLLLAPKPVGAKFTSTYDPKSYPEAALPVLRAAETHHIFVEDEWGDYLLYHLYPAKRVFVDGRSDFYGDDFNLAYLDLLEVKPGWQKTLDKYSIDTVALAPKFALCSTLKISRDWRVVYDDGITVVFRRTAEGRSRLTSSLVSSNEGRNRDRAITKKATLIARSLNPVIPERPGSLNPKDQQP